MRISKVSPTFCPDQSDMQMHLPRLNLAHTTFTPPINSSINSFFILQRCKGGQGSVVTFLLTGKTRS